MISKTKRWSGVALLTAGAVALVGCSSGGAPGTSGAPGDSSNPSASADTLPNTAWVAAERDQIQDGGSLTLALDDGIANWNYYNADAGTVDSDDVSQLFLPSFIRIGEDGSWEPDPNYADSVELTSEDPQVVTVKINADAAWSDGTPITAADVQGMFTALSGENPDYAPNSTNVWNDMESVEQGDTPQDVIITFKEKNADWMSALSYILPTSLTADPETFNTAWQSEPVNADGEIISAGPFILESYDTSAQVITFARNDAWWGEPAKLDNVVFRVTDRASVGQSFANSELDVAEVNANADTLQAVQARGDGEVLAARGRTFSHITINGTSDVFSDVAVRRAFAQSINREILAQAALEPLGVQPEVLNNLIFLPGQNGYTDDSAPIAYDIDAANAALDEAGWTAGSDGIRERDGERLTVRLVIPSETPNSTLLAQQIQPMAKEAGFDVQIETVPSADFFTNYVTVEQRDFDATLFAWQGTAFPISSTESIFYPADSGQNYPGVTDESLGELWANANAELDPDARLELATEIDQVIVGLATTVPLFARPNQMAVKTGLVNYGPAQFESIQWENVGWLAE